MLFAVFPSEISNSCWINDFRKRSWGRNGCLMPEFFRFQRLFCSASTLGLAKVSVGKKMWRAYWGVKRAWEPGQLRGLWEAPLALNHHPDSWIWLSQFLRRCTESRQLLSPQWLCPGLCWGNLSRWKSHHIHTFHKVLWWADILQCRGSPGRVPPLQNTALYQGEHQLEWKMFKYSNILSHTLMDGIIL